MGTNFKRTRLWINPAFQTRLLLRLGMNLVMFIITVWNLGFFLEMMRALGTNGLHNLTAAYYLEFLWKQQPLLMALALLVPIVAYDSIKFSHRVAGPLFRCRRLMQQMARGQRVPEFHPRKHDLLKEFFEDFNTLIKECNARVAAAGNGKASEANTVKMPPPETGPAVEGSPRLTGSANGIAPWPDASQVAPH
jgi:hypothetical protein